MRKFRTHHLLIKNIIVNSIPIKPRRRPSLEPSNVKVEGAECLGEGVGGRLHFFRVAQVPTAGVALQAAHEGAAEEGASGDHHGARGQPNAGGGDDALRGFGAAVGDHDKVVDAILAEVDVGAEACDERKWRWC